MMVLGQYMAVLVGTWWYWVSRRRYQVCIRQYGQKVFGYRSKKSEIGQFWRSFEHG